VRIVSSLYTLLKSLIYPMWDLGFSQYTLLTPNTLWAWCVNRFRRPLNSTSSVGSLGELGGTAHIEARTTVQARENITLLSQNFKAMGLWVLLLIRFSTFTLLSDVRHITHTCTQKQIENFLVEEL